MPELKRNFMRGRMNKDLDERIVLPGEYRDAQNIEILTSELSGSASNAGSVQNILGNQERKGKTYNVTNSVLTNWSSAYISNLTNPVCVGSVVDTEFNKIYWFITSDNVDAIAEYDDSTGVIAPVLVDKNSILNFSSNNKITGINVIDGLLYWTDNQYEPKGINVKQLKSGSTDFNTHTKYDGSNLISATTLATYTGTTSDFVEKDITVIREYPLKAPTLTMSRTYRANPGGADPVGTGDQPAFTEFNFSRRIIETEWDPINEINVENDSWTLYNNNDEVTLTFTPTPTVWNEKDTIIFETTRLINKNYVTHNVTAVISEIITDTSEIVVRILAMDQQIPASETATFVWSVVVQEEEGLFELKFPRFAYRWKYKNSQYSCYSPFSLIGFLPGRYKYMPHMGYNRGMVNHLKTLTINIPDTQPNDVDEVDLLMKESDSNVVYVVTTLKNNETSFTFNREVYKGVIKENQLLRPWDNVPKKAKAQELVGNRILYGNYTQNYDLAVNEEPDVHARLATYPVSQVQEFLTDGTSKYIFTLSEDMFSEFPDQKEDILITYAGARISEDDYPWEVAFSSTGVPTITFTEVAPPAGNIMIYYSKIGIGQKSLKSQRTYQAGLVYLDTYGRQSPVFSGQNASFYTSKETSVGVNRMVCDVNNLEPPSWATHYKWFVKEGSTEYYNLILDTFYEGEDGNMWLAFPSSDRNKVDIGDFLELKKNHGNNTAVKLPVEFKIIDIKSDPPSHVVKKRVLKESNESCKTLDGSERSFTAGTKEFEFFGPDSDENPKFHEEFDGEAIIRIISGSNTSQYYDVATFGPTGGMPGTGSSYLRLKCKIERPFDKLDSFLTNIGQNTAFTIEVYHKEYRDDAEFIGKFFVKVPRSAEFDTYVAHSTMSDVQQYIPTHTQEMTSYVDSLIDPDTGKRHRKFTWVENTNGFNSQDEVGFHHPELGSNKFSFVITDYPWDNNIDLPVLDDEERDPGGIDDYLMGIPVNSFDEQLNVGTLIQFENCDNQRSVTYKITQQDLWSYGFMTGTADAKRVIRTFQFERLEGGDPNYVDEFNYGTLGDGDVICRIHIVVASIGENNSNIKTSLPAVFETEPKLISDLDLFYEASDTTGILKETMTLTNATVSSVALNALPEAPTVLNVKPSYIEIDKAVSFTMHEILTFTDLTPDGYSVDVIVMDSGTTTTNGTMIKVRGGGLVGSDTLEWFNCYSWGNGVESNRIREDYNAVQIDKGPKVSTVLDQPYKEEIRKSGLIYSGIYNSTSGVNDLNQFLIAEKITKDVNPEYGGIQKLHARDTDVTVCCEDKIVKVLANKDALYNADGDINLTASTNVLGQTIPYVGEYGISKNPESFVGYAYRSYFTDKARGAILRLSRDGLTNISSKGMNDWFQNNLASSTALIGSYEEDKNSYNLTLDSTTDYTISFNEGAGEGGGWTSFKSFIPESGCSLNNVYYTFKNGLIYSHDSSIRNTFYGDALSESSLNFILNDDPSLIKNFKTINYEGSTTRKYTYGGTIGGTVYDSSVESSGLSLSRLIALQPTNGYQDDGSTVPTSTLTTKGWYLDSITTDMASGSIQEFVGKENKYYNYIKGDSTTLTNLDTSEFSVQGIGSPSVIVDLDDQTKAKLTLKLNGIEASNNFKILSVSTSDWSISSTDSELIENENITVDSNINSTTVSLTLAALDGYTLPTTLTIASETPSSSVNLTSYDNATGVCVFTFESQVVPATGLDIVIIFTASDAAINDHSISGKYSVVGSNLAIPSIYGKGIFTDYSDTGSYNNRELVFYQTVSSKPDFAFCKYKSGIYVADDPVAKVITQNDDTGLYEFEYTNNVYDSKSRLISRVINVYYTYGETKTVANDRIGIIARANGVKAPLGEGEEKVKGYIWETRRMVDGKETFYKDDSDINVGGETRYLTIFGDEDAKYGITCSTATVVMGGSVDNIAADAKTLPVNGRKRIRVVFAASASAITHTFTLTGTYLNSTLIPNVNPFTIAQRGQVTLTLNPIIKNVPDAQLYTTSGTPFTFDQNTSESLTAGEVKFNSDSYGKWGAGSVTRIWIDKGADGTLDTHLGNMAAYTTTYKGFISTVGASNKILTYRMTSITDDTSHWDIVVHNDEHLKHDDWGLTGQYTTGQALDIVLHDPPNAFTVYEDDDLDGVFNTAANTNPTITRTFIGSAVPTEDTKFKNIPFKFVYNSDINITAGDWNGTSGSDITGAHIVPTKKMNSVASTVSADVTALNTALSEPVNVDDFNCLSASARAKNNTSLNNFNIVVGNLSASLTAADQIEVSGSLIINKYGTANTTVELDFDRFLLGHIMGTKAERMQSGFTYLNLQKAGTIISTTIAETDWEFSSNGGTSFTDNYDTLGEVGNWYYPFMLGAYTTDNTANYVWRVKVNIVGNFLGKTSSDITLSYSSAVGIATFDASSSGGSGTLVTSTNPIFTGTGTAIQAAHFYLLFEATEDIYTNFAGSGGTTAASLNQYGITVTAN